MADAGLGAVAALGEFFDIVRPAPRGAPRLTDFAADPDQVGAEIDRIGAVLGARAERTAEPVDVRAVASLVHLGLVARVVAPVVGAQALLGTVPFATAELRLLRTDGGGLVLSAVSGERSAGEPAGGTDDVVAVLTALGAAFAQAGSLSPSVLWGNAGSAVASAVALVAEARPDVAAPAHRAARALLAHPRLAGTGAYVEGGWRRSSCCLYYRIPGGGLCGDCVLSERPPARR